MKVIITIALSLLCLSSRAQITDNFSDNDFTASPAWHGDQASFTVSNGRLQSNNTLANATYYLSTPSSFAAEAEWLCSVNLQFNPSSVNYADFFVMSDSADLNKARNAYFIRIGSTQDDICLYKIYNGVTGKIIDGADGLLNKSNNDYRLKLLRKGNAQFSLYYKEASQALWTRAGTVSDTSLVISGNMGIRIRQSSPGFFNRHFFDDISAGNIVVDTIKPRADSLVLVNEKQVTFFFSEPVDSFFTVMPDNYKLNGSANPANVTRLSERSCRLTFSKSFTSAADNKLAVSGLRDMAGNLMLPGVFNFVYYRIDTPMQNEILITEIMADPEPVVSTLNYEYVELYNRTEKYFSLSGCRISDGSMVSGTLKGILKPRSYMLVSAKTVTSFPSLNNNSETVYLFNQHKQVVHSIAYTDRLYGNELKRQGGWSLEMIDVNNPCNATGNWKASEDAQGGTPAYLNSVAADNPDHTAPLVIEAYAAGAQTIRLGLSEPVDSISVLNAECRLSDGQLLSLQSVSADRTTVWLSVPAALYKDSIYSIAVSGFYDCSGNVSVPAVLKVALGKKAQLRDIVINEILFNPRSGGYDFAELYNRSDRAVELKGLYLSGTDSNGNALHLSALAPGGAVLLPGEYLLLSENIPVVCTQYSCGDRLRAVNLDMPSMPDDEGTLLLTYGSGEAIDSLHYFNDWHFPLIASEDGVSLERISTERMTNERSNWNSAASVIGYASPGYRNSQYRDAGRSAGKLLSLDGKTVSPDEDGFEDVLTIHYAFDKPSYIANMRIYNMDGLLVKTLLEQESMPEEGMLSWNGTDNNKQKAPIGIYIIMLEAFNAEGKVLREKISCVVAAKF